MNTSSLVMGRHTPGRQSNLNHWQHIILKRNGNLCHFGNLLSTNSGNWAQLWHSWKMLQRNQWQGNLPILYSRQTRVNSQSSKVNDPKAGRVRSWHSASCVTLSCGEDTNLDQQHMLCIDASSTPCCEAIKAPISTCLDPKNARKSLCLASMTSTIMLNSLLVESA